MNQQKGRKILAWTGMKRPLRLAHFRPWRRAKLGTRLGGSLGFGGVDHRLGRKRLLGQVSLPFRLTPAAGNDLQGTRSQKEHGHEPF
jgi:hypothetical protein